MMDPPAEAAVVSDESAVANMNANAKKRKKKDKKEKDRKDKKKLKKERKRKKHHDDDDGDDTAHVLDADDERRRAKKKRRKEERKSNEKKSAKKEKKSAKKKKRSSSSSKVSSSNIPVSSTTTSSSSDNPHFSFDIQHTLAPMVGASELAFRLLCRKYGATLAYTPMMSAAEFSRSDTYRRTEFQTIAEDRPLVCHFAANQPEEFASAAKLVENVCDAIDLNLGCPQRTAYVGHFGSYLLDPKDRQLVLDIVKAGSQAVSIPIFVKIRLLDTLQDTIDLCRQLRDAGASLIAIHGRYRASFERKGPGARDGPAMLDQIAAVKEAMGDDFPILSNGNVISYPDVVANMKETKADGIMSAEGILDDPALYLERFGGRDESDNISLDIIQPSPLPGVSAASSNSSTSAAPTPSAGAKKKRKLQKKLREIEKIEKKISAEGADSINSSQKEKLATKDSVEKELKMIEKAEAKKLAESESNAKEEDGAVAANDDSGETSSPNSKTVSYSLKQLYEDSDDRVKLAHEYLALARRYPVKIRSVIFHTRRMCRDLLNRFQLMEECVASKSIDEIEAVLEKLERYSANPESFTYDMTRPSERKKRWKRNVGRRANARHMRLE